MFSKAQWVALSAFHTTCAAEGCERPFSWCELHHLRPWSHGGPTDLANALPLCGHHHRRIHDDHYEHERTPAGQIRFRHRWPSRQRRDRQERDILAA
ncbi:MAG TPA: HNH endonuclease signature motif containing protein [Marmoricola sp.]|nr:HNH endonuclease signature motif containing protein [Marmoricola sp.]